MIVRVLMPILIGIFAVTNASFAAFVAPKTCPSIAAVQAEGITEFAVNSTGAVVGKHRSQYDTEGLWGFSLGEFSIIQGSDETYLTQSAEVLASAHGKPVPQECYRGFWCCYYNVGAEHYAFALRG